MQAAGIRIVAALEVAASTGPDSGTRKIPVYRYCGPFRGPGPLSQGCNAVAMKSLRYRLLDCLLLLTLVALVLLVIVSASIPW